MIISSTVADVGSSDSSGGRVVHRLHRVIGQLQGVERMMENQEDCIKILHQLLASRSALSKIATKLLAAESCQWSEQKNSQKLEQLLNQLIQLQ